MPKEEALTPPASLILPGDPLTIPPPPSNTKNAAIKVGPGLAHIPPNTIIPVNAGELNIDDKKRLVWIESGGKRYNPHLNDPVIAIINRSAADFYHCTIPSSRTAVAILPHLAFENATKKTRPQLNPGAVVYARISLASKHMDPELECVDATTGKAGEYGELKGGMLFSVSLGMARRLLGDGKKLRALKIRRGELKSEDGEGKKRNEMSTGREVLEELGQRLAFEIAVGRNGKIWVDSEDVRTTLCIGRCIVESEFLTGEQQRKLVRDKIKEFGL
ncbi:hypothetical protein BDZ91DRAFT_778212 [Kalaharituber pfeilii]|nr:hypothetical protein BDZ91DRAFT_778212 [Kalaharituber pfeilii]